MTAHVMHPRPARRMTATDAGFLYLERPHAPLHVGCLVRLDRALSVDTLVRRIETRQPRLRRYAQRVVPAPLSLAHPTWEDDPEFDAARHVHRWRSPGPGEADLCTLLEALMASPVPRDRPLWEAHLIDGAPGGGSALLLKVHHCMVDGVSGATLLEGLLDERPRARRGEQPPGFCAEAAAATPMRAVQAVAASLANPMRGAAATLGALVDPERCAAVLGGAGEWAVRALRGEARPLPWNAPLGPRRRLAFTRLPLADARWIRTAYGGTVNDVVLTALAGGLRRYLQARGLRHRADSVTALVPVSLRAPGDAETLGNRISALRVPLALGPANELDRLAATFATTERLKERRAFEGLSALLAAVEVLPAPLVAFAASRAPLRALAHLLATNVPGPRGPRWLAGRRVGALHPIAPIADGIGLAVAVFSYDGWLHVGLHADAERVPDLEKLRSGVEEAFVALRAGC